MDAYRYVLILAACVAVTLPLEFVLGARVYRRPIRAVTAIAPVAVLFLAWDVVATARGVWWFSDQFTLGPKLFGLPVEEYAFFVVVPLCALLTYEAVGAVSRWRPARRVPPARSAQSVPAVPAVPSVPSVPPGPTRDSHGR
jgi:lycopene cyclase domain-containing protein